MDHEVVFFEVRSTIRLAAVTGGGERRVLLLDETGEEHKLSRRKVLHQVSQRVSAPIEEGLLALKLELTADSEPFDVQLLWEHLEDGRRYELRELSRVYFDCADDPAVAKLVVGLTSGGRVADCIRLRKGYLQRLDAESVVHLRAAREREAREEAGDDAFMGWFDPLRAAPTGQRVEAPPEHSERFEILVAYALGGEKCDQARAGRRLGRRLGIKGADAILAELERVGVLARHTNPLPHRHRVPVAFRAEALRAAAAMATNPPAVSGLDLRSVPTIAIDDAFTRDVDDALSVWEEDGATQLAVHIAHVAHAVPVGGSLDREGRRRGCSVYFADDTIPMLPWELTESYLSLEAGQDRRAVSLLARVRPNGSLEDVRFAETQVRVDERMSYEEDGSRLGQEVRQALLPVARALRDGRRARGAVILALPYIKMRIDGGCPTIDLLRQDGLSHLLVSELMVTYNAELGRRLAAGGAPALFRNQPKPARAAQVDPADPLFPLTSRRGLPPTVVSTRPGPQRTLGVDHYVQGTSPIRRYGDLVAQRQLLALLAGQAPVHDDASVLQVANDLERSERRARTLEEERERYWIVQWLSSHQEPLTAYASRVEEKRRMIYLPVLCREFPCELPDGLSRGQQLQVVPLKLDPRAIRFTTSPGST